MREFFGRLQNIDRRVLYLLLMITVSLPFLFNIPVPMAATSPQTQSFYETLESQANDPARRDKLVIVSPTFDSSTSAENLRQTETMLRHLMKRHLKFGILAFDPQGRELAQKAAEDLQTQYGYHYGTDYVNFGYRPFAAMANTIKAMVHNIPGAVGTDYKGTKLEQIPVMKNVKTVDDIGGVIEITAAQTLPAWLGFFQHTGKEAIPTLLCTTAVQAPENYPYMKSGQLQGMLVGLQGAIEYEGLLKERGFATRASASLSYAHFLILGLIIVGNIGMFAARKRTAGGDR